MLVDEGDAASTCKDFTRGANTRLILIAASFVLKFALRCSTMTPVVCVNVPLRRSFSAVE